MYPVHTRLSILPLWAPLTSFPSLRSRVGKIYPHTPLGPSGNLVCAGGRWDDQQQVSQPPPPPAAPPSSTPFRRVNPKYLSASHTALLLVSLPFQARILPGLHTTAHPSTTSAKLHHYISPKLIPAPTRCLGFCPVTMMTRGPQNALLPKGCGQIPLPLRPGSYTPCMCVDWASRAAAAPLPHPCTSCTYVRT